jgi:hypothetical protein
MLTMGVARLLSSKDNGEYSLLFTAIMWGFGSAPTDRIAVMLAENLSMIAPESVLLNITVAVRGHNMKFGGLLEWRYFQQA